jgi:hypothetical protein
MDTGVTKEYQEILKIKGKLSSSENDPKNLTKVCLTINEDNFPINFTLGLICWYDSFPSASW